MLRLFFAVVIFSWAAQGRRIPTSQSAGCRVVNDEVNRILESSNRDFERNSIPVYIEGINQYVSLSIDGSSIPSQVYLNTPKGELRSLATLSRSSNATKCSDGDHITLEGEFQFDTLDLHFNDAESNYALPFHVLKSRGTFIYNVKPTVNILIAKSRHDCHLDSYSIRTTESVDYKFQPDSTGSWLDGRILANLLQYALHEADSTPLLKYVQEATKEFVESYFTKAWCSSLNPSN